MKILVIHNAYGKHSGEEAVVEAQISLLKSHGHEVCFFQRSSRDLHLSLWRKIRAFFTGLYNPDSIILVRRLLLAFQPDVVHIHNLYPIISPAVLPVIHKTGTPVVMTVHNFRLLCPCGLFFVKGKICEKCTGRGKELNCLFQNCERSLFKTLGYALRNFVARKSGWYLWNVDRFMCLSHFQREKLIQNNFSAEKISVLPNFYRDGNPSDDAPREMATARYVAWSGRISPEKGIHQLFVAARLLPDIEFRVAGTILSGYNTGPAPVNVIFLGMLDQEKLDEFYRQASMLVITSTWYEGFPMILPEAMRFRLPVIAPRLGGLPEIVENNLTGLTYHPGDSGELARKIRYLWDDQASGIRLGDNGYRKFLEKYTAEVYYKGLMEVYGQVVKI